MVLFTYSYESKGRQLANQKEKVKKAIPGAVFVEDIEKPVKIQQVKRVDDLNKKMAQVKVSDKITAEAQEADSNSKKIRKLKKLLREIEQIEEKVQSNQVVEKEQLEKLKKKESILNEISELGDE